MHVQVRALQMQEQYRFVSQNIPSTYSNIALVCTWDSYSYITDIVVQYFHAPGPKFANRNLQAGRFLSKFPVELVNSSPTHFITCMEKRKEGVSELCTQLWNFLTNNNRLGGIIVKLCSHIDGLEGYFHFFPFHPIFVISFLNFRWGSQLDRRDEEKSLSVGIFGVRFYLRAD